MRIPAPAWLSLKGLVIQRIQRILRSLREIKMIRAIFFARKERKVLFPLVFHAGAGGVANFVTTRERKEDDSCLEFRV